MMRIGSAMLLAFLLAATPAAAKPFAEMFPGKRYDNPDWQKLVDELDYRQGDIKLETTGVTLKVPAGFYFVGAGDARKVLVDAWGNPPAAAEGVLGMVFPAAGTPLDDVWGATVTYNADGHVQDDEAASIDYAVLLQSMKEGTESNNAARKEQGYDPITLVGWASAPFYDREAKKLHWAKELKFGDAQTHTLNYDVRALGRNGVLEIGFISEMSRLDEIKGVIPAVLAMSEFDAGHRYADFDPSADKVAAYGIGGLIAGVAAKKLGLLALALVFLKKFWFIGLAAIVGLLSIAKRLMSRKASA